MFKKMCEKIRKIFSNEGKKAGKEVKAVVEEVEEKIEEEAACIETKSVDVSSRRAADTQAIGHVPIPGSGTVKK